MLYLPTGHDDCVGEAEPALQVYPAVQLLSKREGEAGDDTQGVQSGGPHVTRRLDRNTK